MSELYVNSVCIFTLSAYAALAYQWGAVWALGLTCLGFLLFSHGPRWIGNAMVAWGLRAEEAIAVDENALMFQDGLYCPQCQSELSESDCYLKAYMRNHNEARHDPGVPFAAQTITLAGYAYCEKCNNFWTAMERASVRSDERGATTVDYGHQMWPRFQKQWNYNVQRLCDPDEHTNFSFRDKNDASRNYKQQHVWKYCTGCRAEKNHLRHTLAERGLGWGSLRLLTNYLSVDECFCLGCRRRQWVSRTVPFY